MTVPQCRESETFLLARAFTLAQQQTEWPWHHVHIHTGPPAKSSGIAHWSPSTKGDLAPWWGHSKKAISRSRSINPR